MKKISTATAHAIRKVESQRLAIVLALGDRWSWYCVLDETGEVLLEQKLSTIPKAMREVFGEMPRNRIKTFWDSEKNSRACKRGIRSLRTVQTYYSGAAHVRFLPRMCNKRLRLSSGCRNAPCLYVPRGSQRTTNHLFSCAANQRMADG